MKIVFRHRTEEHKFIDATLRLHIWEIDDSIHLLFPSNSKMRDRLFNAMERRANNMKEFEMKGSYITGKGTDIQRLILDMLKDETGEIEPDDNFKEHYLYTTAMDYEPRGLYYIVFRRDDNGIYRYDFGKCKNQQQKFAPTYTREEIIDCLTQW